GTAQDTLEGLCLSAGLGTPWAPPGGAGGGVWGEGRLGVSAESAAPAIWSRIKRKTTSTSIFTNWIQCDRWIHALCLDIKSIEYENVKKAGWKCPMCN
ncbi:hypothetical protein ILYODFUR_038152, partial [Ilyodon furcidens]